MCRKGQCIQECKSVGPASAEIKESKGLREDVWWLWPEAVQFAFLSAPIFMTPSPSLSCNLKMASKTLQLKSKVFALRNLKMLAIMERES